MTRRHPYRWYRLAEREACTALSHASASGAPISTTLTADPVDGVSALTRATLVYLIPRGRSLTAGSCSLCRRKRKLPTRDRTRVRFCKEREERTELKLR